MLFDLSGDFVGIATGVAFEHANRLVSSHIGADEFCYPVAETLKTKETHGQKIKR